MKKIISLIFFFSLIFVSLSFFVYNDNFYNYLNGENNTVSENIVGYLLDQNQLDNYFSEREILHMVDVKKLINFVVESGYWLLFVFFILINGRKDVYEIIKFSFVWFLSLVLLMFINFDWVFLWFHKLLFKNDYWLLSANSVLIKNYSLDFFMNFALIVLFVAFFIDLGILALLKQKINK